MIQPSKNRPKKQSWSPGACFAIPLIDGEFLLGQVLASEPSSLNSVSCALYNQKFPDGSAPRCDLNRVFSVVMTTRDLLDSGLWKIVGHDSVTLPKEQFPHESLRKSGFVGAKVIGSRIIGEFANAVSGLSPWNDWADPNYLDRLLITPDAKPPNVVYKNR